MLRAYADSEFLFSLIDSPQFKYIANISSGSKMPRSDWSMVSRHTFYIPNKNEQKSIGNIISKLNTLILLQQRKLDELNQVKRAYLSEIFPTKDKNKPKLEFTNFINNSWKELTFSNVINSSDGIRRGPFGSALKKEYFVPNSDYTVYEQNNAIHNIWKTRYFITQNKYQELDKFHLKPGDFILSGAGTIGKIAQVPKGIKEGVFNQALIRIRINKEKMNEKYFLIWMQSLQMQRRLTKANPGSAMTNLVPISEIKQWKVRVPNKNEQEKIGIFIGEINQYISNQQKEIFFYKKIKKFLLQKLFI